MGMRQVGGTMSYAFDTPAANKLTFPVGVYRVRMDVAVSRLLAEGDHHATLYGGTGAGTAVDLHSRMQMSARSLGLAWTHSL